jgi:hypothetical protein
VGVKNWNAGRRSRRDGHRADMRLRWAAAGLLAVESQYRRIKGFRQLPTLADALHPSTTTHAPHRLTAEAIRETPRQTANLRALAHAALGFASGLIEQFTTYSPRSQGSRSLNLTRGEP